jgi:hypothetical protein
MGMSGDYQLAIECGSTMVRIGSIFGEDKFQWQWSNKKNKKANGS